MRVADRLRAWRDEGRKIRRDLMKLFARPERCDEVAGPESGFITAMGPALKCERWKGHHGNHRCSYISGHAVGKVSTSGAVEWPK